MRNPTSSNRDLSRRAPAVHVCRLCSREHTFPKVVTARGMICDRHDRGEIIRATRTDRRIVAATERTRAAARRRVAAGRAVRALSADGPAFV